jgi:hypothetical protein
MRHASFETTVRLLGGTNPSDAGESVPDDAAERNRASGT